MRLFLALLFVLLSATPALVTGEEEKKTKSKPEWRRRYETVIRDYASSVSRVSQVTKTDEFVVVRVRFTTSGWQHHRTDDDVKLAKQLAVQFVRMMGRKPIDQEPKATVPRLDTGVFVRVVAARQDEDSSIQEVWIGGWDLPGYYCALEFNDEETPTDSQQELFRQIINTARGVEIEVRLQELDPDHYVSFYADVQQLIDAVELKDE